MENDIGCIYKITNSINNKVYVGQTTQKIDIRMTQHFSDAKRKHKKSYKIHNAINKYGRDNFTYEVIEYISIDLLDERECYWINFYDSVNSGYNILLGGKIGKSKIWLGRKHTEETKKKISIAHQGKIVSEYTKQKLSLVKTGTVMPSGFDHSRSISVVQINKETYEVINIFGSVRDAEISIVGKYTGNIHNVINNKKSNKTAYGYIWLIIDEYEHYKNNLAEYLDSIFDNYIFHENISIVQLDYEGNYINQFNSILAAEKYFNSISNIRCCLNKNLRIACGYQWDTLDNYNSFKLNKDYYNIDNKLLNINKIIQISILGDCITEWNNISEIKQFYNYDNTRNIKYAIDNSSVFNNCFWIYYNDYINYTNIWIRFKQLSNCTHIVQLTLDNDFIKVWDSATNIQDVFSNINSKVLLRKLRKEEHNYKNFNWMYLCEYNYIQSEKKNQCFIVNGELGITDILNTVIK